MFRHERYRHDPNQAWRVEQTAPPQGVEVLSAGRVRKLTAQSADSPSLASMSVHFAASRVRFAGLSPRSEPRCTMHRAGKVQPARSPSIRVNGSRGDDTKPRLR